MKRCDRKGQMKLSFGMIFSIILIISFLAFAFYAIQKFLVVGDSLSVSKFANDLQKDVDKMWKSSQGAQEKTYSLPSGIEKVCFVDLSDHERGAFAKEDFYEEFSKYSVDYNMYFYPIGSAEVNGFSIEHIDFGENNPFCFDVDNGKVKINLKKDFGESKVLITNMDVETSLDVDSNGVLQSFLTLAANGNGFKMLVPAGTGLLTSEGLPLEKISVKAKDVSLDSFYSNVIGDVVYDMQPDGATFDNPITLYLQYDEADLPKGTAEDYLIVKLVSDGKEEVVNDFNIDKENNIITAKISHFSSVYITSESTGETFLEEINDLSTSGPFVAHLYEDCLGRNAEYAGYISWRNALDNGVLNVKEVINDFVFSQEFVDIDKSNEEFVETLYKCVLGRDSNGEGTNWVNSLDDNSNTREDVLRGFLDSEEFVTYCSTFENVGCDVQTPIDLGGDDNENIGSNSGNTGNSGDSGSSSSRTKCSPVQMISSSSSGWSYCYTTSKDYQVTDFDHTGAGCRTECGKLGYKSWGMWSWDGEDESTCWCSNDEELTKTHCTFRAGTCEPSKDVRECRYIYGGYGGINVWIRHCNNYDNLFWQGEKLERSTSYINYFDKGGYRFTIGDFVKRDDFGVSYEVCSQPLSETPACTNDWDCDDWCHENQGLRFGMCGDDKCYCTSSLGEIKGPECIEHNGNGAGDIGRDIF